MRIFISIERLLSITVITFMPFLVGAQILSDFYIYNFNGSGGYDVALSDNFYDQLNKPYGGFFSTSDGYTWKTGDPLPNPAPNGMFNGVPVTGMSTLFMECNNLVSLDLSKFNTVNVTDMSYMFMDCSLLTALNVSSFNVQKVKDMTSIFQSCVAISNLDLSSFVISPSVNLTSAFMDCTAIKQLNICNFNLTGSSVDTQMLTNCGSAAGGLAVVYVNNMSTANLLSQPATGFDGRRLTFRVYTGVSEILDNGTSVSVENGAIIVSCDKSLAIAVYDIAGRVAYSGIVDGTSKININSGFYIVKVGVETTKIFVE